MFTLSKKEIDEHISVDAEHEEYVVNSKKFCEVASALQAEISLAIILIKFPLYKWILGIAAAILAALQTKLGCEPE